MPSPPSATGRHSTSASGRARRRPSATACATSYAGSVPLNLSGATRTRVTPATPTCPPSCPGRRGPHVRTSRIRSSPIVGIPPDGPGRGRPVRRILRGRGRESGPGHDPPAGGAMTSPFISTPFRPASLAAARTDLAVTCPSSSGRLHRPVRGRGHLPHPVAAGARKLAARKHTARPRRPRSRWGRRPSGSSRARRCRHPRRAPAGRPDRGCADGAPRLPPGGGDLPAGATGPHGAPGARHPPRVAHRRQRTPGPGGVGRLRRRAGDLPRPGGEHRPRDRRGDRARADPHLADLLRGHLRRHGAGPGRLERPGPPARERLGAAHLRTLGPRRPVGRLGGPAPRASPPIRGSPGPPAATPTRPAPARTTTSSTRRSPPSTPASSATASSPPG